MVVLYCNSLKHLYLKDKKLNIIPSIKNEHCFIHCFIHLRTKAQKKLYLGTY